MSLILFLFAGEGERWKKGITGVWRERGFSSRRNVLLAIIKSLSCVCQDTWKKITKKTQQNNKQTKTRGWKMRSSGGEWSLIIALQREWVSLDACFGFSVLSFFSFFGRQEEGKPSGTAILCPHWIHGTSIAWQWKRTSCSLECPRAVHAQVLSRGVQSLGGRSLSCCVSVVSLTNLCPSSCTSPGHNNGATPKEMLPFSIL